MNGNLKGERELRQILKRDIVGVVYVCSNRLSVKRDSRSGSEKFELQRVYARRYIEVVRVEPVGNIGPVGVQFRHRLERLCTVLVFFIHSGDKLRQKHCKEFGREVDQEGFFAHRDCGKSRAEQDGNEIHRCVFALTALFLFIARIGSLIGIDNAHKHRLFRTAERCGYYNVACAYRLNDDLSVIVYGNGCDCFIGRRSGNGSLRIVECRPGILLACFEQGVNLIDDVDFYGLFDKFAVVIRIADIHDAFAQSVAREFDRSVFGDSRNDSVVLTLYDEVGKVAVRADFGVGSDLARHVDGIAVCNAEFCVISGAEQAEERTDIEAVHHNVHVLNERRFNVEIERAVRNAEVVFALIYEIESHNLLTRRVGEISVPNFNGKVGVRKYVIEIENAVEVERLVVHVYSAEVESQERGNLEAQGFGYLRRNFESDEELIEQAAECRRIRRIETFNPIAQLPFFLFVCRVALICGNLYAAFEFEEDTFEVDGTVVVEEFELVVALVEIGDGDVTLTECDIGSVDVEFNHNHTLVFIVVDCNVTCQSRRFCRTVFVFGFIVSNFKRCLYFRETESQFVENELRETVSDFENKSRIGKSHRKQECDVVFFHDTVVDVFGIEVDEFGSGYGFIRSRTFLPAERGKEIACKQYFHYRLKHIEFQSDFLESQPLRIYVKYTAVIVNT